MAKGKYTVIWLAAVFFVKVLSADTTWKESMKVCGLINQRPSTEKDNIEENDTWIGKAKYVMSSGVIILQIKRIEENETCSECCNQQKRCQNCMCPVQLNKSGSSFNEWKSKLTPGKKYIIEASWSSFIEEIPVPTTCLVYRGASYTEYVSCYKYFEDGCTNSSGLPFKVIIYLEENNEEGTTTTTYTSDVPCHTASGNKNGSTVPRGSLVLVLAFFLIH